MVDEWPSRLPTHHPHLPASTDELHGVAALAPQFDLAVSTPRRSVAPIGSLSPQGVPYGFPSVSAPTKTDPFQTHAVFTPNPQPSLHHVQSAPLPNPPAASPSVLAADFLAECTHAADLQSVAAPQSAKSFQPSVEQHTPHNLDFDLFGLANLDLGPPVFEPQQSRIQPQTSPSLQSQHFESHPQFQELPFDQLHRRNQELTRATSPTSSAHPSTHIPPPPVIGPSSSPTRTPRELSHPTRCVLLRNIPPGIDDDDIRQLLQVYGPLRDLGAQQRSRGGRGSLLATYFDLRHARSAVRALDSAMHFGRRLEARFQCPADGHTAPTNGFPANTAQAPTSPSANQGTLVVFNLDTSTSAEDIRAIFSSIGDVKEIRATPNKKHHKFVEFYDVRDAERAMHLLNKTEVGGKRIKIEISRPGGRASNPRHGGQLPKLSAGGAVHQARQHPGQAHVQYSQDGATYPTPLRHQSLDGLPSIQGSAPLFPPLSRAAAAFSQSSPDASFDGQSALSPNISHIAPPTPTGFDATNALSGSLERSIPSVHGRTNVEYNGMQAGYDGVGESRIFQGATDSRSSDFHPLFSGHRTESPHYEGLVGNESAVPKAAPDSYIRALYHSPGSDEGHSVISPGLNASPRSGAFNGRGDNSASHDGGSNMMYRRPYGETVIGGNSSRGFGEQNSTHMQQLRKVSSAQSGSMVERSFGGKQVCAKSNSHGGTNSSGGNKSGGNQLQNNSKYSLDIRRVISGEETRTALMIRNIPNKYNQKMLLSTLEEGHKGHFDFIYLPIDFKNKCNVGYAFINFTKPEFIEPFYKAFHGKKWGRFNSEKVCEITFARIQGRQQLIAHFQNSSLLLEDPKCRPVIFDSRGRQEEFPIGSHVRTRRGPSSRDASHRSSETTPPYSPSKNRGRS